MSADSRKAGKGSVGEMSSKQVWLIEIKKQSEMLPYKNTLTKITNFFLTFFFFYLILLFNYKLSKDCLAVEPE